MLKRIVIGLASLPAFLPVLLPALLSSGSALADTSEGEKLFGQCLACHQIGESAKHLFGPALNGVNYRSAGIVDDYIYSGSFKKAAEAGLKWDDESLDKFLESPLDFIVGTKMAFPGVRSDESRASIIAYLKQYDENGKRIQAKPETVIVERKVTEPRRLATDFTVPDHGVLHLGRRAFDVEVVAWDIDIRPDGLGLPIGSGNAIDGSVLYENNCASCHGSFGEGTVRWPVLAGGEDTLTEERPEKTIGSYWPYLSTVYDYIRRAMPFGNSRSLSDDDVYAITAYILFLNDLADEEFELNSDNFASIRLPNEANFTDDNRHEEAYRQAKSEQVCMSNCFAEPAKVTQRARVLDVTPDSE
ncbi:UNVERIFIED_CONTAM: hypothetical protein GTU68_002841 [Idotea baltica]|nr:hypothetical protein [Idotea baltica]